MIREYFSRIRKQVFEHPSAVNINFDSTATDQDRGFWKAKITFRNGSELHLFEYITENNGFNIKKYRYHFQNSDEETVFRYDNAPHHPEIETHPEHKHEKEAVKSAEKPEINQILEEVTNILMGLEE